MSRDITTAEREGFEPSDPVTQVNSLAVSPIRPLSHLSGCRSEALYSLTDSRHVLISPSSDSLVCKPSPIETDTTSSSYGSRHGRGEDRTPATAGWRPGAATTITQPRASRPAVRQRFDPGPGWPDPHATTPARGVEDGATGVWSVRTGVHSMTPAEPALTETGSSGISTGAVDPAFDLKSSHDWGRVTLWLSSAFSCWITDGAPPGFRDLVLNANPGRDPVTGRPTPSKQAASRPTVVPVGRLIEAFIADGSMHIRGIS